MRGIKSKKYLGLERIRMSFGKIIFLNGVSSSGKTSLARELQNVLDEPYFLISIDTFYDMIPEKFQDDEKIFFEDMHRVIHHCIQTFAKVNVNVIVDHVLYRKSYLTECLKLLKDLPVLFIGVHCPLEELERREKARGNRNIGQAKNQLKRMHKNEIYDIEVNTFENSLNECAVKIKDYVNKTIFSEAYKKMYDRYQSEIKEL